MVGKCEIFYQSTSLFFTIIFPCRRFILVNLTLDYPDFQYYKYWDPLVSLPQFKTVYQIYLKQSYYQNSSINMILIS